MNLRELVQAPDLPDLIPSAITDGDVILSGARVRPPAGTTVRATRLRVSESELDGVSIEAEDLPGLTITDAILRECGLSNIDGREGFLRRVELRRCQLVGFGLGRGEIRDLRAVDCSLELASFAGASLHGVIFERVNLVEASFMEARLAGVVFSDCRLTGTDFRGAKLSGCAIRGSSLDDVLGVESLGGVRMPWPDVLASAAALAAALGIAIETD
jgi:uncharacterized protein YjbI with pentapeptide repeats